MRPLLPKLTQHTKNHSLVQTLIYGISVYYYIEKGGDVPQKNNKYAKLCGRFSRNSIEKKYDNNRNERGIDRELNAFQVYIVVMRSTGRGSFGCCHEIPHGRTR